MTSSDATFVPYLGSDNMMLSFQSTSYPRLGGIIILTTMILFACNVLWCSPGYMTFDSQQQYAQALQGVYTDWHPPIMAWVWSLLDKIVKGSLLFFLMQLIFYWSAFGLLSIAMLRLDKAGAAIALLITSILPPLLMPNSTISKDVGMAVTLLLAFALIFFYRTGDRKIPIFALIIIIGSLAYASLVRANGVFATSPVILYLIYPNFAKRALLGLTCIVAITFVMIPMSNFINHRVLKAEQSHPLRSLQIFDLAGIAHYARDPAVFWDGPFTIKLVDDCYHPALWDTLAHGAECHVFWDSPSPDQSKKWVQAIARHPLAYLQHRFAHFNSEMQFLVPVHSNDDELKDALVFQRTPHLPENSRLRDLERWSTGSVLFSPILGLAIAIVSLMIILQIQQEDTYALKDACIILVVSGILYTAGYMIVGVASDQRYQYWPAFAFYVSGILCVSCCRADFAPMSRVAWYASAALVSTIIMLQTIHILEGDAWTQFRG